MFQFPRFPPRLSLGHTLPCGVAPFGHRRITGCQPLPGAFRRVATSFLGSRRLGIHPMRFCGVLAPARAGPASRCSYLRDARGDLPVARSRSPHPDPAGRSVSLVKVLPAGGWSRGDSNPGPPPCKGGALPAKLRPPMRTRGAPPTRSRVGAPGLEPGTSALSGPRSHHLSYAPVSCAPHAAARRSPDPAGTPGGTRVRPVSKTKQVPFGSERVRRVVRAGRAAPAPGICVYRRASSGPRALLPDRPPGDVPRSRSRSLVPRRPGLIGPAPDLGCLWGVVRPRP